MSSHNGDGEHPTDDCPGSGAGLAREQYRSLSGDQAYFDPTGSTGWRYNSSCPEGSFKATLYYTHDSKFIDQLYNQELQRIEYCEITLKDAAWLFDEMMIDHDRGEAPQEVIDYLKQHKSSHRVRVKLIDGACGVFDLNETLVWREQEGCFDGEAESFQSLMRTRTGKWILATHKLYQDDRDDPVEAIFTELTVEQAALWWSRNSHQAVAEQQRNDPEWLKPSQPFQEVPQELVDYLASHDIDSPGFSRSGRDAPPSETSKEGDGWEDLVTLDQAAASVYRSKRALENYKGKGLPGPCVKGGGGKPDLWEWREMRPWLAKTFGFSALPARFPERLKKK